MNVKVNGEYLGVVIQPEIVRQAKTASTLDGAGDFSYQFELDDTAENRRKLQINDLTTFKNVYPVAYIESNGYPIHTGNLRIEGIDGTIKVSFFSGNTNWFGKITGFVYEIDLSQFKIPLVNTSPSATLVATWDNTEGIIFPLLDRGRLVDWANRRLDTRDFLAMTYLKNIVEGIFRHHGIRFNGELFSDALFNTTVVGSPNRYEVSFPYYKGLSINVGKQTSQTITSTPSLITFPVTTYPFYNGSWSPWDPTTSKYTAPQDTIIVAEMDAKFSGSVNYTFEIRVNGLTIKTITGTGTDVTTEFRDSGTAIILDQGEYFEVWGSIDSGAVDITSGSLKTRVISNRYIFPQLLLADMTQEQVIRSVFLMFNVIAIYDPFSKTVTCNLFRNIENKPEQDLSEYIDSYSIDFLQVLEDVAQHNYFTHQQALGQKAEDYKQIYEIDFGAGDMRVYNEGLTRDVTNESDFTGSTDYYNVNFAANLMSLGLDNYENSGDAIEITSVTDSGGDAVFHTIEPHGLKTLDYVRISGMDVLSYNGLGLVGAVATDSTFELQFIDFAGDSTGFMTAVSTPATQAAPSDVFIASVIPDYLVSNFSNNSTINVSGTNYTNIAYAYFLKPNSGFPVDEMRESVAFGKPFGFTNITLLEKNYGVNEAMFNNPTTVKTIMYLPENVYKNLDFSRPVRLKTKDFNMKFFISKDQGYIGSEYPCEMELIKLS